MSNQGEPTVEPRVRAWEQRAEWPLTVIALLFLVAYAWPILEPGLAPALRELCRVVNYLTWLLFALDFLARVMLARRRGRYVVRHLPDLAVVALPIFRPLRLLRLVLLLRVLNRRASESFRGRVVVYVSGSAVILILCASLAVLDAERGHPASNINTFGDALWWSITTVTTVGYGDHFPATTEGRAVAVGLMIGGIALIGVVTATIASWLIDRVRDIQESTEPDLAMLHAELREVRSELRALHELIAEQGGGLAVER